MQHQQGTTAAATQQSQNVPHPTPNQTPLTQTQNHSQQPTSGGNPQNTQQHHSSSQQQLAQQQQPNHHSVQQQQQSSHNPDYQQQISKKSSEIYARVNCALEKMEQVYRDEIG